MTSLRTALRLNILTFALFIIITYVKLFGFAVEYNKCELFSWTILQFQAKNCIHFVSSISLFVESSYFINSVFRGCLKKRNGLLPQNVDKHTFFVLFSPPERQVFEFSENVFSYDFDNISRFFYLSTHMNENGLSSITLESNIRDFY